MKMLEEESGKTSVKRVWGSIIMLVLLLIFCWKEWHNLTVQNLEVFKYFLIIACILLGLDILKYLKAFGSLKDKDPK